MNGQRGDLLKLLLQAVPPGFLVDSRWFAARNIHRSSVHDYARRGWLERVTHGVYRRPVQAGAAGTEVQDWRILVLSLQHIMGYPVHVGGMTALRQAGYAHYLRLAGDEPVFLYGARIPTGVTKVPVQALFTPRSLKLFADARLGVEDGHRGRDAAASDLPSWWRWPLRVSSPERAVLEALNELPEHESFHNLDLVFESLTTLRPRRLTSLLARCTSIKAKRLFFVFADRHDHAWRKHLQAETSGLGRGDRALVKGGKLHPKYRIMVPADFVPPKEATAQRHGRNAQALTRRSVVPSESRKGRARSS